MTLFLEGYQGVDIEIENVFFYRSGGLINFEIDLGEVVVEGAIYTKTNPRKGWEFEELDYIEDFNENLSEDMIDDLEELFTDNLDYIGELA